MYTQCEKCEIHTKFTRYKVQGHGRKQSGGRTKSIFREKDETTEKIVLMFCSQLPLKRCEHFELRDDAKRMGQMIRVNITLSIKG